MNTLAGFYLYHSIFPSKLFHSSRCFANKATTYQKEKIRTLRQKTSQQKLKGRQREKQKRQQQAQDELAHQKNLLQEKLLAEKNVEMVQAMGAGEQSSGAELEQVQAAQPFQETQLIRTESPESSLRTVGMDQTQIAAKVPRDQWEIDMRNYWQQMELKPYQINAFIYLAKGSPPKWCKNSIEISRNLKYVDHLRSPQFTDMHLQRIQNLFPKMLLQKTLFYNPWLLTLSASTLLSRKQHLVNFLSDCLTIQTSQKFTHVLRSTEQQYKIIPVDVHTVENEQSYLPNLFCSCVPELSRNF
ncbi:hypothetical protein RFI_09865 [Reticulomyxa filosa]|uniref:Uncharacterized protein n=1 Tax=Reticulomyxa filosa TaxID=46433 RepID=X6NPG3_RETFI|nr:hypothetical protein RFI_09865 [Reticulomyxa filosa]|eukprot:ETO27267.1 hypothetical protein RFI_09865 [Reticulomyxa filosa]